MQGKSGNLAPRQVSYRSNLYKSFFLQAAAVCKAWYKGLLTFSLSFQKLLSTQAATLYKDKTLVLLTVDC